jgi:hypothetical protein
VVGLDMSFSSEQCVSAKCAGSRGAIVFSAAFKLRD